MQISSVRASAIMALVLAVIAGCNSGKPMGEVTGKVTLDGMPVKGLEVNFEPKDPTLGTTAIGYTQADGTYKLHYPGDQQGAPVGDYKVKILGGEPNEETGVRVTIPPKYNSQTELSKTVGAGENKIDFELTSR
jgi:hypothetical protein